MRSFSKKLAFVLAAAMVFTGFAPAAKAEAAKEMTINKSSQILYVTDGNGINDAAQVGGGKGNVSEYDFYVKNKPSDWKKTLKFEWSSSNEDVATVNQSGLTTAVSVGKATISCKITEKDGDVVATSKVKVTVKANAADVEIKNASKISGTVLELKDGKAELDLDRIMYDADSNATTKRGTLVTDYTEWMYEPKAGVEVKQSNGVFTFTAPGEYKLYCRTYQSSKYTASTAVSDPVVVTVVDKTFEAMNTTRDDLVIKFSSKTDITAADVTVKEIVPVANGKSDKVEYLVKDVTASADKTSYTVAVFYEFTDGAEYEVAVKGYETVTFTASKGAPKTIVLHSNQYNTSDRSVLIENTAPIWATLYDANGVDVTNADLRSKLTYTIKYADSDYETVDTTLFFAQVGDRATVTAEYHTYEYDDNGNEKNVAKSEPYVFYGVAKGQEAITGIVDYTTNGNYWGDKDVVRMDDTRSLKVKFLTKNIPDSWKTVELSAFNQQVWNYDKTVYFGDANFTSLNPDVLEVYNNGGVGLYPRKIGTARVMVSYKTNVNGVEVETPINAVTINVKAARTLDKISLDTNSLVICVNPAKNDNTQAVEDPIVKLTIKDQYDSNYTNVDILTAADEFGLKGTNKLSQRTVDNNSIVAGLKLINPVDGKEFSGVALDSDLFARILNDMDGNGTDDVEEGKQQTSATRFSYVLSVKDKTTKAVKTVNFSVDVRRAAADVATAEPIIMLNTSDWKLSVNGNDVARTWSNDYNDNTERVKAAEFVVYQMTNGAKYDEIKLEGVLPGSKAEIRNATAGYYYVINKAGTDISSKGVATVEGTGTKVTLNFSSTKPSDVDSSVTIVDYKPTEGAGTYEFILYQIKEVNGVKDDKRIASRTLSVSCKQGSYSFVSRDAVTAASDSNADLIKCFTIADRSGNKVSHNSWDITDTEIKFNNTARKYNVNLDLSKTDNKADSVFVKSITVWESVGDAYVEYTVPVGYFVKVK